MQASYPAVFEESEQYGFSVIFPDLNFLAAQGKSCPQALEMAIDCLAGDLWSLAQENQPLPAPSAMKDLHLEAGEFPVMISADPSAYAKEYF